MEGKRGYFSFHTMISTPLIKVIYVIGVIGITIGGVVRIVQATQIGYGFYENLLVGLAIIVLGNLSWRLACEGWILVFNMHDLLASIERELKRK